MNAKSLTELAKALNRSKGQVSAWKAERWWPNRVNGEWDVDACRRAIETNVQKLTKPLYPPGTSAPASSTATPAEPLAPEDETLLAVLKSPGASAVDLLDAALRLAARRVAQAGATGGLGARDVSDLTRASEELRRAREAAMDLAEREERLIPEDVAAGAVGDLVERLLRVLNNVATLLPARVEEWREDPRHHALEAKDRGRVVMEWFESQCRTLRTEEADLIDGALAASAEDLKA